MRAQTFRADMLMLVTAIIWGAAFVAQKIGMDHIGPFLYSALRFFIGALIIAPLVLRHARQDTSNEPVMSSGLLIGGVAMGIALSIAINIQQVGLIYTTVTNSGFITGLYVIFVPMFAFLIGQKTGLGTWVGAAVAVAGMVLLSVNEDYHVALGDWIQLAGAAMWAVHVLVVGIYAGRYNAIRLAFVQFVVCAVVSLVLAIIYEEIVVDAIISAGPALLYGGVLAVGVGFTLQVVAQKHAIASHAAIILSLEAVFAALTGALILGESLTANGYIGCSLMLAGMLCAQLWPSKEQLELKPALN